MFVNSSYKNNANNDIFDVNVDLGKWPMSNNWAGGYKTLAHELLHLMGLPDEYNRIETHSGNKYLSVETRLELFLDQLGEDLPLDSVNGIMCYTFAKPLERHVCAAVGLGKYCINERMATFHKE